MSDEEVLAELRALKPSELKKRAREAGVDDDALDEAADADNPKEALVALVAAAAGAVADDDDTGQEEPAAEAENAVANDEQDSAEAQPEQEPAPDPAAGAATEEAQPEQEPVTEPTADAATEEEEAGAKEEQAVEADDEQESAEAQPEPEPVVVPEGVPPADAGMTRSLLLQLGASIDWDEEMVDSTLGAMDGDLQQCAALLREQGATAHLAAEPTTDPEQDAVEEPNPESEPEPEPEPEPELEPEPEQPDLQGESGQEETATAASENTELDAAKSSLFAGAAPKSKKSPDDAALDAAKGSLFAGAKPSKKKTASDDDAALAEAKGALFGEAKTGGGDSPKKSKGDDNSTAAGGEGLGLTRDSEEVEAEPVRSLDDLDAGDMSMMTIDEELQIAQARLESGKTYYQILWTEQGGIEHDVWRRYSEFDALRKKLCGKKGGHKEIKSLDFPKKTKLKSKGNNENVVDDRQAHLQKWLQQLVMAKQLVPDSEGDNGQKMLYDFLSGDNETEFHRMMTDGVPEEGSMKAIGSYD